MWNISSWAVVAAVVTTVAALVVAAASVQALGLPQSLRPTRSPLEAAVLSTTPAVGHKAGHPSSVPSPVRAAVAAEAGMHMKEQAETVVAVVVAGAVMLLRLAGPDHTATTAARMLEATPIKSVLAEAEQAKLAQLGLLAARQVRAAMAQPVASQGLL